MEKQDQRKLVNSQGGTDFCGCDEICVEMPACSENLSFSAVYYPQNHTTVQAGRMSEVHPAQSPVQNKPNFKARLVCSGPCLVKF